MHRLNLRSSSPSTSANKIRVLTLLVHNFRLNMTSMGSSGSKESIASSLLSALESMASDKAWYKTIKVSFSEAITKDLAPEVWMANQLKELGVYEVGEEFQRKGAIGTTYECMSFASELMNETLRIDRINSFPKISKDKLKTGDFMLYYTGEWQHIALYVGEINGKSYAISKFGTTHNVFFSSY